MWWVGHAADGQLGNEKLRLLEGGVKLAEISAVQNGIFRDA